MSKFRLGTELLNLRRCFIVVAVEKKAKKKTSGLKYIKRDHYPQEQVCNLLRIVNWKYKVQVTNYKPEPVLVWSTIL